jgi:tRNA modification GTPase
MPGGSDVWFVQNKIDLVGEGARASDESQCKERVNRSFTISASSGLGVDVLLSALEGFTREYFSSAEPAMVTRARHRRALEETVGALGRALDKGHTRHEELIAEELHSAATSLGRLTGRVDVEDILDVIFRDFCIGK